MSIEDLKNALPDYAKDLKLNLSSLAAEMSLTDQQPLTWLPRLITNRFPQSCA